MVITANLLVLILCAKGYLLSIADCITYAWLICIPKDDRIYGAWHLDVLLFCYGNTPHLLMGTIKDHLSTFLLHLPIETSMPADTNTFYGAFR